MMGGWGVEEMMGGWGVEEMMGWGLTGFPLWDASGVVTSDHVSL